MSADNWTKCPNCIKIQKDVYKKEIQDLNLLYGKINPEEFIERMNLINKKNENELHQDNNLREDYDIGIYENYFEISYSGHCNICTFEHTFKHSEKIL